jgi:hypothetical protein
MVICSQKEIADTLGMQCSAISRLATRKLGDIKMKNLTSTHDRLRQKPLSAGGFSLPPPSSYNIDYN